MRRIQQFVGYAWALPATIVGLLLSVVALCAGATVRIVEGAVEVGGGPLAALASRRPATVPFVAITFGHVIIGIDHAVLRSVRLHEHVHVRQYERWGILFFPLYLASSVAQLLDGRDPYVHNRFEREAYAATRGVAARACADDDEETT